ncbi:MAG: LbtU family siderophore porin [Gammaproteobacteria bacterium]|nr:LbtU family siderophore porin [Gammaproteobacteria bacterium]
MKLTKITLALTACLLTVTATPLLAREGGAHPKVIEGVDHNHWLNRLTISGILEAEMTKAEDFSGVDTSDIVLATVELGFDAVINDRVDAHLAFLYEEDDTALEVDEGTITVAMSENSSVVMGQMYLPFGSFETNMISDPLTLELGEIRESALLVSFGGNGFTASVFAYNGDMTEATAEEQVDQFGVSLGFTSEGEGMKYDIGVDYINNIGDSDGLTDAITAGAGGPVIMTEYVGAYIVHAIFHMGSFTIIGEHLATTDPFDPAELAFNGAGAEPTASNIELGFDTSVAGKDATIALGYQATDEAQALGLPESKILAALSINIMEDTALSFEVSQSTDYDIADGGTGEDANAFTLQLAVGF